MADLKLRRLRVSGFKSLVTFELDCRAPTIVLTGPNGVGESTILQAIDFIRYFAEGKPQDFLEGVRMR